MSTLLTLALACTGPGTEVPTGDFEATATLEEDIPTVAWVRWTTDSPGTSWVEYGRAKDDLDRTTLVSASTTTDHAVLLAGMGPSTTWFWRAVSEVDGERLESAVAPLETGVAPRELPRATAGTYDTSLAMPGYTLTTSLGDESWVIVYDEEARPVWFSAAPADTVIAQARLAADGTSILYNVASLNFGTDVGQIRKVRLDGELLSETRTVMGHHDFVELPDGGFAYIAADIREWTNPEDGEVYDVVGDAIIEIPEGATDDTEGTVIWSTWDDLDVHVDPDEDNDFYPQGLDWTHSNSLAYDAENDSYALSVRKEDAFVEIDRATGALLRQIGGIQSDFTLTSGRAFVGQHSAEFIADDRFILFDNGDVDAEDPWSEAVEYSLDQDARTYTPVWTFDHDREISSYLLGDVERLANGNTLVAWGSGGTITEVTANGELAFKVSLGAGSALGFTHHVDALGGATE